MENLDNPIEPAGIENLLPKTIVLPNYINFGNPSFIATNERVEGQVFETIKNRSPNGYLYGPGAGMILALIEGFPLGTIPKGCIIVDIDPAVVLAGKALSNSLRRSNDWGIFRAAFADGNEADVKRLEDEVLDTESEPFVKRAIESHRKRFEEVMDDIRWRGRDYKKNSPDYFLPLLVIEKHYPIFHQLAQQGNIAVIYADMFNPEILRAVVNLPSFRQSNNIIYLSNAPGHTMRRTHLEDAGEHDLQSSLDEFNNDTIRRLNILEPQAPHKNIFIDAVSTSGYSYGLRVQDAIPQYAEDDLEV